MLESAKENFCGAAFITFNTIKEQEDYLYKIKNNCCYRFLDSFITLFKIYFIFLYPFLFCFFCYLYCNCCNNDKLKDNFDFYKRKISFERAPEPEDIIFENLEVSFKTKLKKIICFSFVTFFICLSSTGLNMYLYILQSYLDKSSKNAIIFYVYTILITIITNINDLILEIVLEKLIKRQNSYTLTDFYATYGISLTFYCFLNSWMTPIFFEQSFPYKEEHEILTSNLITRFLVNSFITLVMWTINFKFVYKKFKQCLIEQKEKINYNQKELNELYELQSMNITAKYSYLAKTLLLSFYFAPIFPLGFGISFIGFIFGYWLEKYNFSKKYKKPEKLGKLIAEYYVIYFFFIFFVFSAGSSYFISSNEDTWIRIIINIYAFLIFIPFQQCFKKDFFKFKESEIHKKTYDEMYLDFITDYERANPMTRIEGEMRYLDKLEEKKKINKIKIDKRKKKIKERDPIQFYLQQQRMSRMMNIKELNNLLNLDDDDDEQQEKDIICNIENSREEKKNQKKNTGTKGNFFIIETGTSIQKVTKKEKTIKSTYNLSKIHNKQ